MNLFVTTLPCTHDLMVDTCSASQAERASRNEGEKERGKSRISRSCSSLDTHASLASVMQSRSHCVLPSIFNHIFNIHHTFPISFKVRVNREGLGRLENPFVFKLSKIRLCEHDKWTVRPTGLDIISASDALAESSDGSVTCGQSLRELSRPRIGSVSTGIAKVN